MEFVSPLEGQHFERTVNVLFEGTCDPNQVDEVRLIADGGFPIEPVALADGKWSASRQFSGIGPRQITATGFSGGQPVDGETATRTITLFVSELNGYHPPAAALGRLGGIALQLEGAQR